MIPKLESTSESTAGLINTQITGPAPRSLEFVFLTRSQMMLMLLWGPHFVNHHFTQNSHGRENKVTDLTISCSVPTQQLDRNSGTSPAEKTVEAGPSLFEVGLMKRLRKGLSLISSLIV